jgi:peptidoglycan/xylan/chitin deacetylase (PgdA/CDA1 family)/GT2 family glycosyltransferase
MPNILNWSWSPSESALTKVYNIYGKPVLKLTNNKKPISIHLSEILQKMPNQSEPNISLVIPAYNEEKYLPRCLKSLKDQDFRGTYEIIVVDNKSTDKTKEVAESQGVKVIFEPRRGVCFARQRGTGEAAGEIVVSTDADCFFPKNWLSSIYQSFQKDQKIIGVLGPCEYTPKPIWGKWWTKLLFGLVNSIYRLSGKIIYPSATNFAFKKKAWLSAGGYNTNLTQGGDEYDLLRKLKDKGPIVYLRDNKVLTSPRRLKRGLFYSIFLSLIYYYFVDYFIGYHFFGKSLTGPQPAFRQERAVSNGRISLIQFLSGFAVFGLVIYYLFFSSTSQVFGKVIYGTKNQEKLIALTFDDGPNEPYTSQIVDILDKYQIKGTFFEVGENIELYPAITYRIFKEGHIIGNHSYSHSFKKPLLQPSYNDEIKKTQAIIYGLTGKKPALFRPPWFFRDPLMLHTAKKYNLEVITGTFGSNLEVFQPGYDEIAEAAINKIKSGQILVLHDGYNAKGASREETVQALEIIIPRLLKEGYRFVTVPELLHVRPYQ